MESLISMLSCYVGDSWGLGGSEAGITLTISSSYPGPPSLYTHTPCVRSILGVCSDSQ